MKSLPIQTEVSPTNNRIAKWLSLSLWIIVGAISIVFIYGLTDTVVYILPQYHDEDRILIKIFSYLLCYLITIAMALDNFKRWKIALGRYFVFLGGVLIICYIFFMFGTKSGNAIKSGYFLSNLLLAAIIFIAVGTLIIWLLGRIKFVSSRKTEYVEIAIEHQSVIYRRIIATLIDYSIFFFVLTILIWNFGEPTKSTDPIAFDSKQGSELAFTLIFWYWILYFPTMEALTGKTLGKVILNIQVVRENPNSHPFTAALFRRSFDILDICTLGIVSIITMYITKGKKRFSDLIAGSIVMKG